MTIFDPGQGLGKIPKMAKIPNFDQNRPKMAYFRPFYLKISATLFLGGNNTPKGSLAVLDNPLREAPEPRDHKPAATVRAAPASAASEPGAAIDASPGACPQGHAERRAPETYPRKPY